MAKACRRIGLFSVIFAVVVPVLITSFAAFKMQTNPAYPEIQFPRPITYFEHLLFGIAVGFILVGIEYVVERHYLKRHTAYLMPILDIAISAIVIAVILYTFYFLLLFIWLGMQAAIALRYHWRFSD